MTWIKRCYYRLRLRWVYRYGLPTDKIRLFDR